MIDRLFPAQIDNDYRGSRLAIALLVPVVLMKFLMGLNVAGLNPWITSRDIIVTADAIPLDTFSPAAQSITLFLFSSWGLGILLLSLLGLIALVRYRAMIPLIYLVLMFEQVGRKILSTVYPIARSPSAGEISVGVIINWGFAAALVIGFVLSLSDRRKGKS